MNHWLHFCYFVAHIRIKYINCFFFCFMLLRLSFSNRRTWLIDIRLINHWLSFLNSSGFPLSGFFLTNSSFPLKSLKNCFGRWKFDSKFFCSLFNSYFSRNYSFYKFFSNFLSYHTIFFFLLWMFIHCVRIVVILFFRHNWLIHNKLSLFNLAFLLLYLFS